MTKRRSLRARRIRLGVVPNVYRVNGYATAIQIVSMEPTRIQLYIIASKRRRVARISSRAVTDVV